MSAHVILIASLCVFGCGRQSTQAETPTADENRAPPVSPSTSAKQTSRQTDEKGPSGGAAKPKPRPVTLSVQSVPTNAEVFINGESYGRTPLFLPGLDFGEATVIEVVVRAHKYQTITRRVDLLESREQALQFDLRKK